MACVLVGCTRGQSRPPQEQTYEDSVGNYDHYNDASAAIEDGVAVVTFMLPCPGGTCRQTLELGPAQAVRRVRLVDLRGEPLGPDAMADDDGQPVRQGEVAALFLVTATGEASGDATQRWVLVGTPEHDPEVMWSWPGPDDDPSARIRAMELIVSDGDWLDLQVTIERPAEAEGTPPATEVRVFRADTYSNWRYVAREPEPAATAPTDDPPATQAD